MLLAWLTLRQTVFSSVASALSRPSGRPTASSVPRTTRCVKRCTRWSAGLPEYTCRPAARVAAREELRAEGLRALRDPRAVADDERAPDHAVEQRPALDEPHEQHRELRQEHVHEDVDTRA